MCLFLRTNFALEAAVQVVPLLAQLEGVFLDNPAWAEFKWERPAALLIHSFARWEFGIHCVL